MRLEPQITGGGQQDGLRSGTLNVAGIVGFATALELCLDELPRRPTRLGWRCGTDCGRELRQALDDVELCGPASDAVDDLRQPLRLPGNLECRFGNVDGEALLLAMGNLAVSTGAACTSTDPGPSHVLLALGLSEDVARSSLRFGLGRFNTAADVDFAAGTVSAAVTGLRQIG